MKILSIDDKSFERTLFKDALQEVLMSGYSLTQIYTVDELIHQVSGEEFDCVFIDFMMPVTGDIVAREVRRKLPKAKIIIITGHDQSYVKTHTTDVDGFVSKNSMTDDLKKVFNK